MKNDELDQAFQMGKSDYHHSGTGRYPESFKTQAEFDAYVKGWYEEFDKDAKITPTKKNSQR